MKLLAPEVVAPLSVCSTRVQIRGNIAGATVRIFVGTAESASHVTKRSDGVYDIGVPLQANEEVTAKQELGSDLSDASLPVKVQDVPAQLSALTVHTVLHECGRAVYMTGGVPGAKVEGAISNQPVGASELISGQARVIYDPVLAAGQPMVISQLTCNSLSLPQTSPPALLQPSPLPEPLIHEPLIECQTSITIAGVTDGAYVELYRNGELETYTFSTPQEWRWVKPLQKDDLIEVRQGFKCKSDSPELESFSDRASATVQPVDALGAPNIVGTPCPGITFVTVSNLIPGTRVVFLVDDEELGQTDTPASTFTFAVPPLPAGAVLKAFMVLCDKDGPADTATVSDLGQSTEGLGVSNLYACAAYVYVAVGGTPGNYLVSITNKNGQQISAYHNLIGFHALIPVSPSLIANDDLTVNVLACGGTWEKFGPYTVSAGNAPPPTFVEPVVSGDNYVMVSSLHAGALIDVSVNDQWSGSAISVGNLDVTVVGLSDVLETGDEVFGTQTLCGRASRRSKTVKVQVPKPEQPVLLEPEDGEVNVSTQPLFKWSDPGAGQENEAGSFHLVVKQGSTTVINTTVTDPQHQSGSVLQHDSGHEWTVVAGNATGETSANVDFTFETEAAPEPQEAELAFVPPISSNGPLGSFPRNEGFDIIIELANQGNIDSEPYVVYVEIVSQPENVVLDASTASYPALAAGGTDTVHAPAIISDPTTVRINAVLLVNDQQVDMMFALV